MEKTNAATKTEEKTTWKSIKRSVGLIYESNPSFLALSLLVTIFLSLLPVASLLVMQAIINFIQLGQIDIHLAARLIVFYVAIDIVQVVVQTVWQQYTYKFSLRFKLHLDILLQKKLKHMSLADYEDSEIYDNLRLAQTQNGSQIIEYIGLFTQCIGHIIGVISHIILLLHFKQWMVCMILLVPFVKYKISNRLNQKQYNILKSRTTQERKAWYWSFLITSGNNYKELTTYNLFDYFTKQYRQNIKAFNAQDVKLSKTRSLWTVSLTTAELLLSGALFAFIIYSGYRGDILIGNIITYTRSIMSTKTGIDAALQNIAQIKQSSLYTDLFFDFIDLPATQSHENASVKIDAIETIEFKHVSFRYKGKKEYAVKNINVTLKKNNLVVIVGKNGSGKTTLAKLMMGFYQDYEGTILVNGINLKQIDRESYLSLIGSVFQDFTKYEATIRENIAYGNLADLNDDAKINRIQRDFKNDFLPVDTQVGNWFDDGTQISVGQWQKLALGRAFIKDADFYILDEPNASLDPLSEFEIAQLYRRVFKNKLGVIIAHKFNNLTLYADNILVMENGELSEQGTHQALVGAKGRYFELYNLQAGHTTAARIG